MSINRHIVDVFYGAGVWTAELRLNDVPVTTRTNVFWERRGAEVSTKIAFPVVEFTEFDTLGLYRDGILVDERRNQGNKPAGIPPGVTSVHDVAADVVVR